MIFRYSYSKRKCQEKQDIAEKQIQVIKDIHQEIQAKKNTTDPINSEAEATTKQEEKLSVKPEEEHTLPTEKETPKIEEQPQKAETTTKKPRTQKAKRLTIDDLPKLKQLLDSGVITQEEFDQKKKDLLDL